MLRHDLRYGWRMLRQHALVTTTIVITLGLGIGVNTAMFSVLNAVVLRTLPLPDVDRLFSVNMGARVASGAASARLSGPMFDRLRASAPQGVGITAMSRGVARVHTRAEGESDTTPASLQLVSSSFFSVLGAAPVLGQALPDESNPSLGPSQVAVVSHAYWQRRFGGSADVIGRTLTINGAAVTVIGVGPKDFAGVWLESPVDIWVPLSMQGAVKYSQDYTADGADQRRPWLFQDKIWWLYVVVRAPAGKEAATVGAFNGTLSALAKEDVGLVLEPFARGFSRFRQEFSPPLYALTAMALLVLFIACANVANLLLARSAGRQREIAVRVALGAGRARLFHQLLTESALLIIMAGAVAILFAKWAGDLLVRTATATAGGTPPFAAPLDMRVLAFTAGVAFMSVLIFGLIPAAHAVRLDVAGALKSGSRGTVGRFGGRSARALVILQVALSLVLVAGTGLIARSFQNLLAVDLGFERQRLLSVTIDPRLSGMPADAFPAMYERALTATTGVPGVQSAALAMCGLQNGCRSREDGIQIEGYRAQPNEQVIFVINVVSQNYFSTVGMPIIAGRPLNDRDLPNGPRVAVVNKTLAATYFAGGQAIGRHFGQTGPETEIVGIVDDARLLDPRQAAVPTVFFPLSQRRVPARSLEVRTQAAPELTIAAVRRALVAAVPELPIDGIVTMDDRLRLRLSPERLIVLMTSGFGVLAMGLAGFGLFGILSNAVARRTAEFGLRMALGATRPRVIWSVVREALWLVVIGLAAGLPIVLLGGRLVWKLLFGVSPYDPVSLATATAVLIVVGAACSALPALRASRVDPIVALRQE
jgi:predicted permease